MTPQQQDTGQVQELLGAFYAGRIDRNAARASVLDVILARIGCQRVSMWKFESIAGRLDLLCFASKTVGGELDTRERRLLRSEYRDYFNALIERGTYVAGDAMNDPSLAAMRESYLVPNCVRSLLDAAFMLNGRAYGKVCCEQTDAPRAWRAGDVLALRAIVTRMALLMSSQSDPVLLTTPSLPARPLSVRGARPTDASCDDGTG